MNPVCFFADRAGAGPCNGALIGAHLVARQTLRKEFPHGVVFEDGRWRRLDRREDRYDLPRRTLRALIADERNIIPCCGGPRAISGHHGMLDYSRKLRIARADLPPDVESFAAELGLVWYLDRTYGEAARAA